MPIPLPTIADTFRCALRWSQIGGSLKAVNVIHIKANASGQTATDAFHALNVNWNSNMWLGVQAGMFISNVDVTPLDGVSATTSFVPTSAGATTGGSVGDIIIQAAIIVKLGTGVRGRDNRGRIFLPYPAESQQSSGHLSSATQATMDSAWGTFAAGLVGLSPQWDLGVASYDRRHSGAGAHFTGLTHLNVEELLGTQRKRMERLRR